MAAPPARALTIQSTSNHDEYRDNVQVVIGVDEDRQIYKHPEPRGPNGQYWFSVYDRTNLSQLAQAIQDDNSTVPAAIQQYENNNKTFMVLVASSLNLLNLPQGALHAFLYKNGAGKALQRFEQVIGALSCGSFSYGSYILVDTLGIGGLGFELQTGGGGPEGPLALALSLEPIEFEGNYLYTPAQLNS